MGSIRRADARVEVVDGINIGFGYGRNERGFYDAKPGIWVVGHEYYTYDDPRQSNHCIATLFMTYGGKHDDLSRGFENYWSDAICFDKVEYLQAFVDFARIVEMDPDSPLSVGKSPLGERLLFNVASHEIQLNVDLHTDWHGQVDGIAMFYRLNTALL